MKLAKTFTTAAVSLVAASAMMMSASAATYEDAVQAAKEAGVPAVNVQQLQNFFELNGSRFTSADYDHMIEVLNGVRDTYVTSLAQELFGKSPAELTEDEKYELGKNWSVEEKNAIVASLVDLGEEYGVKVDANRVGKGEYTVAATVTDSNGNKPGTQTVVTKPVADTGSELEAEANTGVMAVAGAAIVLAAAGVVIVAKKNKA